MRVKEIELIVLLLAGPIGVRPQVQRAQPASLTLGRSVAAQQQPPAPANQSNASLPPARINPAAQALLDRAIQALGGAAFMNFKTLTTQGRAFSIADGVTQGFVFFQSGVEFPARRRLSYGFAKKKRPIILINDGNQGWQIDRFGLIEQRPKQIQGWQQANRYALENFMRLRIHERGILILEAGEDFIDYQPAKVLSMTDARQVKIKLYLQSQTMLPIRIAYRIWKSEDHDWDDYEDDYADYQPVRGVETPMHIIRRTNGQRVAETFRTTVKYDEVYPANYFKPSY